MSGLSASQLLFYGGIGVMATPMTLREAAVHMQLHECWPEWSSRCPAAACGESWRRSTAKGGTDRILRYLGQIGRRR